jgi:hypothetical protein
MALSGFDDVYFLELVMTSFLYFNAGIDYESSLSHCGTVTFKM